MTLFFPSEAEQIESIDKEAESEELSTFALPQDVIDTVLRLGGRNEHSRQMVAAEFMQGGSPEEIVDVLKTEYRGGHGLLTDEIRMSAWFNDDGIRLAKGGGVRNAIQQQLLPWEDAAVRIGELLETGEYATNVELAEAAGYYRSELALAILYLRHDFADPDDGVVLFPSMETYRGGGYPQETARLAAALADPVALAAVTRDMERFLQVYEEERGILRFHYHHVPRMIDGLHALAKPWREYTSDMTKVPDVGHFVIEEELDEALVSGSHMAGGKNRINAFFSEPHSTKEQADFLRAEYGTGGFSGASSNSFADYDGKGFRLSKEGAPAVHLSWTQAAKRVDTLVKEDRYLTEKEKAQMEQAQTETREESTSSSIEKLYEHYLPVVREAVLTDTAYRNACMNSDKENAMIEGEGAVNRAILTLHDTRLYGLYYDNSDFHDRLTLEVLEETYSQLTAKTLEQEASHKSEPVRKESGQEEDAFADIDPERVRERLAEHGIVNGELVDPDKLEQSPFIQMVEADVERIASEENVEPPAVEASGELVQDDTRTNVVEDTGAETQSETERIATEAPEENTIRDTLSSEDRFHVIDVDWYLGRQAYSIWDDMTGGYYVDRDGVTVDFTSRWNAEEYRSELIEKAREEAARSPLDRAKDLIDQYCMEEFSTSADFDDMTKIPIGYTTVSDEELPIEASVDLINFKIERYLNDRLFDTRQYDSLEALIFGELENLDFNELMDATDDEIAAALAEEPELLEESEVSVPESRTQEITSDEDHEENETVSEAEIPAQNFRITDDHLGEGGPKQKYGMNVAAIRTLQTLEAENRSATPGEQETLSKYVGWGSLADAFDPDKTAWLQEYQELKGLLTEDEYAAARASTLNAHYTSPTVIRAIYDAVEQMGFTTGNILEPSMGVGNFFGLLPDSMQGSRLYGVELDSITGRIAQKLYPDVEIKVAGFETTDRRDFYDLAVGNVPFGDYKVNDRPYNKLGFSIHNYFFAKALDQVRPGGVVAFVTSRYTMDAKSPEVRKYLAQRAELLGAIRLPNNAFKANAGTEVVSDIIFLQKRDTPIDLEPDWVHLGQTPDGLAANSYFIDHPEMVMGTLASESTQYGREECTVLPIPGADLAEQLREAVSHIHGSYHAVELTMDEGQTQEASTDVIPAAPSVKNFSFTAVDGEIYFREDSVMRHVNLNDMAKQRALGTISLRQTVNELIEYQLQDYPDEMITMKQKELERAYDQFTADNGLINSRANAKVFGDDSSYYLLCSLENVDEDGNLIGKADMFTKRTIRPDRSVTSVDTPVEALAVSIGEQGGVDLPFMAELLGTPGEYGHIIEELSGVIFRDPFEASDEDVTTGWHTADDYLSGDVRAKLQAARLAADKDPAYAVNVSALEKAQPKDLDASEIDVRLGATWIDKKYIQQFMEQTFETPFYDRRNIRVKFSPVTAEWQITGKTIPSRHDVAAYVTYGTDRANAYRILEEALNLKDIRIFDTEEDWEGNQRRILNKKETTLAQQKQQAIKDAFQDWIWKDPHRREELCKKYNELFNSTRPREYDGSHIRFVGMNPEITLREHQKNAIAHVLYGGNTLLAHEVGAGKTFEMAAAAMESKRLGLCQKSLFVVPNHLTMQWANEFLRLYPSAKLLVATRKDFETARRKKFCARIATGDYDAVIIGHSQFEKIPISAERQERQLREQIEDIQEAIKSLKYERGENFTVKQMEKSRRSLEAKLEKLTSTERKDDVVTFEQLGVDRLFVDESHSYKNLFLYTKMRNVAGLSTSEAQKSSDMYMECRYMDEITGGRGVVFATGTPVSNSMTELYTVMRYLQYGTLQKKGLTHFDSWASTFSESQTAIELAPEGTGYRARTRFAHFFNLPELMNMFKEVADIKTSDQLNLPVPDAKYETVVVQPSEYQKKMVQDLSERAAKIHAGLVDSSEDNMLCITSDGRKIGLDQRLMNPLLPDDPNSKLNTCVENVFRIWQDGTADKLTQLLFCDMSTPKSDGTFNVYDDIRTKLEARDVPHEEIAFIHDADTEAKKKELFAKVRNGQVRVLLGSTQKMGAGTNVQDRLIAVHHLDVGWRPADLTQRNGRIIRQGNMNKEVQIYNYVTQGTFDAYLWQTLENKQKFISQVMTSKSPVRACDDVDEQTLSYAEVKALCAGDSRIKEKMDLDIDVARLKVLKADFRSKQYRLEDQLLKYFPREIEQQHSNIEGFQKDAETVAAHQHPKDGFAGMTVAGITYTEKLDAGEAILAVCKMANVVEGYPMGSYRGFQMELSFDSFSKEFNIALKGSMTHRVLLGSDARGNLTRLDNALNNIPAKIEQAQTRLEELEKQQEAAREEVGKPFPQEKELAEKSARLAKLDAALNLEDGPSTDRKTARTEQVHEDREGEISYDLEAGAESRSSVLADLKQKAGQVPPRRENNWRGEEVL
ncbi:MAG: SNF2-related protein [Lachnospiraceae bacterium]|nr:SNF2-related protein [Lachnospiraceae bacterium]